jgi:hypothetical protein
MNNSKKLSEPVTHSDYFSITNIANVEPGNYFSFDNNANTIEITDKSGRNKESSIPTPITNQNTVNGSFIEDFNEEW